MAMVDTVTLRQTGGRSGMGQDFLVATRVDEATYLKLEKGWTSMTWSMAELTRKILMAWNGDPRPLLDVRDEVSPLKYKKKIRVRSHHP